MRSIIQCYGGKGNMIAKLMRYVPLGGKPYCEPFMGAASLFFARPPAENEVLNDLNEDIVNLFRVFQNKEDFEELKHILLHTLYSRSEFVKAIDILNNREQYGKIDRAWAVFVCANQGFSGRLATLTPGNWGRTFEVSGDIADSVNRWLMRLFNLDLFRMRLMRAQIDCIDGIKCIKYWDNEQAVFYVDPPYVLSTRKDRTAYQYEMDDEQHKKLVEALLVCKGSVTLSGYDHEIYKPLTDNGWEKVEIQTVAHAAGKTRNSGLQGKGNALKKVPRTECIWYNQKAKELLQIQGILSQEATNAN